jgi:LmbE family N-acetylglucosaminyl deacetylase
MMVVAHPDDDTFGIARSMALHAHDRDLRFVLVHATDGEAGDIAPDLDIPRHELAAVRREEDEASWGRLGRAPDRHEWLGLPDGGVADHFDELTMRIAELLNEERPDVVATFGPDGITGHPDHIAVGGATSAAFHRCRAIDGDGLRRLIHAAIPESDIHNWNRKLSEAGLEPWDPARPYHLRGVSDTTIGISVDTRGVADLAVAALRMHRTQWSPAAVPGATDRTMVESLRKEDWVIVWPPNPPGSPVLSDIFSGV